MRDKQIESLCIWSGPPALLLFLIGYFPLAHIIPPPLNPATPLADVLRFYAEHRIGIEFGAMTVLWGSCLMIPFYVVVFAQIRRIEPGFPYLSAIFLFCSAVIVFEIILPPWVFATIALRESRPDQVTLALSDLAWEVLIWPNPQTIFMLGSIGIAILRDPNPKPLFPRWLGFYNVATSLLFAGSTFSCIVYNGPLAWNGLLAFWMPMSDFGIWFVVMMFALRAAVKRDDYVALPAAA